VPDFRAYIREHLPPLGVSAEREAEIVEELALEFQERNERAPSEAWEEAWPELAAALRVEFGPAPVERPQPRRENMLLRFAAELRQDLAYAVRQLRKSPGFSAVAIAMLALGIGANTAIFSLMNAVLMRPLPVSLPEQLVLFGEARPEGNTSFVPHGDTQVFSYPFYREFRERNQVFSGVAAIQSYLTSTYARLTGSGPEPVTLELVSGDYFQTLGVEAVRGRLFTSADDRTIGGHPVAIANYAWWQNRLGGDPAVVGRTTTIGSTVYTIVGVTPPGFFGITVGQSPDLWIPLAMQRAISPDRAGLDQNMYQFLHMFGRLKPGVSRKQAEANTNVVFRQILRTFSGEAPTEQRLKNIQAAFISLKPAASGRSRLRIAFTEPLEILMGVTGLVLLIACANLANLLLARAAARQREIAVRMSLGAGRLRLIRQLVAESAVLGLLGAVLGIALAWFGSALLLSMVSPGNAPLPIAIAPDGRALLFTVAVTAVTVLLFGAAPAFRATGAGPSTYLRTGRGVIGGRNRFGRGLVAAQVALSMALLAGAGLFLRSLQNAAGIDLGFDRQNVVQLQIDPLAAGYNAGARVTALMRRIEERVAAVPGIQAASFAQDVFDGGGSRTDDVKVPGRSPSDPTPSIVTNRVGPGYLDVMKLPVLLGRGLTARDSENARPVAVINETMARVFFAGASPLGRTFTVGDDLGWQNLEVVGVMKDAKYMMPEETQAPAAFAPYAQHREYLTYNFVVRYAPGATGVIPAVRQAIGEVDPNLPIGEVRTLSEMVDRFELNRRLVAQLSSFFALLAALLASIGIYGVLSYGIARRTPEFGLRAALGAKRSDVLWTVLRESVVLAGIGVAAGAALTVASGRLIASALLDVQPANPVAIGAAMLAMLVFAAVAGMGPALRATRIDASVALRGE
jgi:predicted permease